MKNTEPKYTAELDTDGTMMSMRKDGNLLWMLCLEAKTNRVGIWRFDSKQFIPMVHEGKEVTYEEFNALRQKRRYDRMKELIIKNAFHDLEQKYLKEVQKVEYKREDVMVYDNDVQDLIKGGLIE